MFYIVSFFTLLRVTSFCLDKIDTYEDEEALKLKKKDDDFEKRKNPKNSIDYSLINFFLYILYPSFIYISPFISFQNFKSCLNDTSETKDFTIKEILILISRVIFWALFIEFIFHATIIFGIHQDLTLLNECSKFLLTCALAVKGLLFSAKYIVFYGIPSIVNKCVGMKITKLPRCIAIIHTNNELWKHFDTGIYEFIKLYLYIPLGGNRISKARQFLSLLLSFIFISYWHGYSIDVKLWTFGNFTMIVCEMLFNNYIRNSSITKVLLNKLSDVNKRRLICFILGLWQMILYIIAFFFLTNYEFTKKTYSKILLTESPLALIIYIVGYYTIAQLKFEFVTFSM